MELPDYTSSENLNLHSNNIKQEISNNVNFNIIYYKRCEKISWIIYSVCLLNLSICSIITTDKTSRILIGITTLCLITKKIIVDNSSMTFIYKYNNLKFLIDNYNMLSTNGSDWITDKYLEIESYKYGLL
jgi:hypothetical protein